MNKFYSLFLAAGSLLTLGVVSSCKDFDEDLYNEVNLNIQDKLDNLNLADLLKTQGYDLSQILADIQTLQGQVCTCNFNESIATWIAGDGRTEVMNIVNGMGLMNQDGLADALTDYFTNNTQGNTIIANKVEELFASYTTTEEFTTAVKNTITKDFLTDILGSDIQIGGMTEDDVMLLVNNMLDGYVKSSVFTNTITDLTTRIEALETAKGNLENAITQINTTLATDREDIDSLFKRIYSTDTTVLALQGKLEALSATVDGLGGGDVNLDAINAVIDSLGTVVATQGSDITDIWAEIKELQAKLEREHAWNEAWQAEYDDKIDDVAKDISNALKVATQYTDSMMNCCLAGLGEYATLADVKELIAAIEHDGTMSDSIKALKEDVSGISAKVDDLEEALNKLTGRMDKVYDRLNAQITSIVIQGSENPLMFNSTFALPLGIQSNILCAYYDKNTSGARTFPTTASAGLVEYSLPHMTAEELEDVVGGLYNLKGESNFTSTAGKLYFTVNPSNCDFSKSLNGQVLYLYDSQNNKCAIRLTEVKKSNKLLTFGASRAADNGNGFYEAIAEINEVEGMTGDDAKLNISIAELKPLGNEIINAIKTRQGVKAVVGETAKLAYQAIQIPAYALGVPYRYTDDNDNQVESWIYSNYGIAALSVHPLSYNFDLTGFTSRIPKRVQRHIPHIAAFRDKVVGKVLSLKDAISISFPEANINLGINAPTIDIDIKIDDIVLEDITATVSTDINADVNTEIDASTTVPIIIHTPVEVSYTYDAPVSVNPDGTINTVRKTETTTVTVDFEENKTVNVNGSATGTATGTANGTATVPMDDLTQKINETIIGKINTELGKINTELGKINTMINDINSMEESLNNQLSDILGKTAESINGQISGIFDEIEDMTNIGSSYIAAADRFIDRVNVALDKIYGVIDNPNYFLQPIMLMHCNGVGMVSTLPGVMSTQVSFTDEKGSFALYPTSYTAEILNPAYKKFVKITNVWGGTEELCKEAMNVANSAKYANGTPAMNTVLPGTYRSVPFKSGSKYAGLTYEITYSAMDYAGYQTVQRYYITVVK